MVKTLSYILISLGILMMLIAVVKAQTATKSAINFEEQIYLTKEKAPIIDTKSIEILKAKRQLNIEHLNEIIK